MKFKLDENFSPVLTEVFRDYEHDVSTVLDQGMKGCTDRSLYDSCKGAGRALVSLDLDFADVTRFPPDELAGVVILRLPDRVTMDIFERLLRQFLEYLNGETLEGQLWIVEESRIRVHETD